MCSCRSPRLSPDIKDLLGKQEISISCCLLPSTSLPSTSVGNQRRRHQHRQRIQVAPPTEVTCTTASAKTYPTNSPRLPQQLQPPFQQPTLVSSTSLPDKEPAAVPTSPFSTPPPAKCTKRAAKRICEVELLKDDEGETDLDLELSPDTDMSPPPSPPSLTSSSLSPPSPPLPDCTALLH
jgi:hypothetical protein